VGSWGCLFDCLGDEEEMGWGKDIVKSYCERMSIRIDRIPLGLNAMFIYASVFGTGFFPEVVLSAE
jgi:hypothetical protein